VTTASCLEVHHESDLLIITLGAGHRAPSFGLAEAKDLRRALEDRPFAGLYWRGHTNSRVFCSGGNLKAYAKMKTKAAGIKVNREIRASLEALAQLDVPTVCAVVGDCFGGGVELVSCFDHVLSVPSNFFGLWQRRVGLSYGWGGGKRLAARIPERRLNELAVSTRLFGAHEALRLGLIDDVTYAPWIEQRALEWLFRALQFDVPILKDIDRETAHFEQLWLAPLHRKILQSFGG
jgi:enoyl-CoA hydratase/carnithine racemase